MKWNNFNPLKTILHLIDPNICPGCLDQLQPDHNLLCVRCALELPISKSVYTEDKELQSKFGNSLQVQSCFALYDFDTRSRIEFIIRNIKYHNHQKLGFELGAYFGKVVRDKLVQEQIDMIIPVPLHKKKQRSRGYNQSALLAHGMASTTGIPCVENIVVRVSDTSSQTSKSKLDRTKNMRRAFWCTDSSYVEGKHLMFIDDVITTGSTLISCINSVSEIENIKYSIACLAKAID